MKKLFLLFFLFTCLAPDIYSQIDYDEYKPVSSKYYIQNATIHKNADQIIENGAIIINNGIIEQIGPNLQQPADAILVNADSMHVYPAFIDALSNTGIKEEEKEGESPQIKFPGLPPDDVAGITPEKQASEIIGADGIKDMRSAGFGISHIVPKGKMLPGKSAIISLSDATPKEKIVQEDVAMFSQLKPASGVFPATMIGVLTKWKELFKQAEGAKVHIDRYKVSNSGLARPNYSPAVQAFLPVISKQQKVFFMSPNAKDIHRVLQLKKQLGFDLVLCDVKQVYPVLDHIKAQNIPVLLSLDLPEAPEEEKEDEEEETEKELLDEELEMMKKRKKETYDKYMSQAKMLKDNGINFSFSWLKAKPKDLHSNIRLLIENGLDKKDALNALTLSPARILGIEDVAGSLESGKMANIMISTEDYFEEKAKIKFMIVDGEVFEYDVDKKKKKGAGGEPAEIVGTWKYEASIPGNEQSGKMIITKSGDGYDVTMTSDDEPNDPTEIDNAELDGSNLTFSFVVTEEGFSLDISVDVEVDGDEFEGTISAGEFGSFPMEGSKVSPE